VLVVEMRLVPPSATAAANSHAHPEDQQQRAYTGHEQEQPEQQEQEPSAAEQHRASQGQKCPRVAQLVYSELLVSLAVAFIASVRCAFALGFALSKRCAAVVLVLTGGLCSCVQRCTRLAFCPARTSTLNRPPPPVS
jgi:hypothetical protein